MWWICNRRIQVCEDCLDRSFQSLIIQFPDKRAVACSAAMYAGIRACCAIITINHWIL